MKNLAHATVVAALVATATPSSAQTTHDVSVTNNAFVPAAITIEVGDTVRWTWAPASGFHNVESGTAGTPDGSFLSGSPTDVSGTVFEVTFDEAFLAANPMPDTRYPYYCLVHVSFGMVGLVTVDQSKPYGACNSTPGSLVLLAGDPDIGGSYTVGVDDPLGSSPVGSLSLLLVATAPQAGYPCGLPLPGYGMSGFLGDLLVSVAPPNPVGGALGPAWTGPGSPAPILVPIPNNPALAGLTLYNQGALTGLGVSRLTEGLEVSVGLP